MSHAHIAYKHVQKQLITRSSAITQELRDALCQLTSCQLLSFDTIQTDGNETTAHTALA